MYNGEVNVGQDDLNSFLQVAEDLRVKGELFIKLAHEDNILQTIFPGLTQNISPDAKHLHPSPSNSKTTLQHLKEDNYQIISPTVKPEPHDMSSTTHQAEEKEQSMLMQRCRTP